MTKIAYCLMVHKNPNQVAQLFKRIYTKEDFFHFQIFQTKDTPPMNVWRDALSIEDKKNAFLFSNYKGSRCTFKQVEAILETMKFFQSHQYDYFIDLSGQCYPLKPIESIKKELGGANVAYLHHYPLPTKNLHNGGLDRIYNYWFNINEFWIPFPKIQKYLPYDLKPYAGSNWFCLPKRFVDYALSYIIDHPKLIPYFSHSYCSDEIFFQTILMNSPLRFEVVNDNKRYIDWTKRGGPVPNVLTSEDFPKLMKSGMWFARKFDMNVDSAVLDGIDRNIMNSQ